jgi:hypothetical protein
VKSASVIIMHWHLQVACEHLVNAAESAAIIHPGTAYAGVIRAAMALAVIASDPHAAQDYGPTATADEALRAILGSLLLGIPAPETKAGPAGTPREAGQVLSPGAMSKAMEPPPAVLQQSWTSATIAPGDAFPFVPPAAPEVSQGALGL